MGKSSKKVALLLHDLEAGGMQSVCLNLVQVFREHPNLELELILSNNVGEFRQRVPQAIKTVDLGIPFQLCLKYVYRLTMALSNYLRQSKPDTILSNLPFLNLVTLLAKMISFSPVSTILVEHTLPLQRSLRQEGESNKLGQRFVVFVDVLMRWLYPYADWIVAPSHGLANELSHAVAINADRLKVIYNPVVDNQLYQKAQAPLMHPWFQPEQPPVILAVGRLTLQKDYETLICGFDLLRKHIAVRLIILGDGPMRPQLESLIQKLGMKDDVLLPGSVENPYAYMARASVFVLSSVWETFGMVLVEALACGCPIIATDCDYGPAEVLEHGKYGILVPPQHAQALADAIYAVLTGVDYDQAISRVRSQAFSFEQSAKQYLNIMGITDATPEGANPVL